jgi:hypothetical protein
MHHYIEKDYIERQHYIEKHYYIGRRHSVKLH